VDATGKTTCRTVYAKDATHLIEAVSSPSDTSALGSSATLTQIITDAPSPAGPAFSAGESAPNTGGGYDVQVSLPGPGTVTIAAGSQARRRIRSATINATPQGIAVAHLIPTAAAEQTLLRGQPLKLGMVLRYTPAGGSVMSKTISITLRSTYVVRHVHVSRGGRVRFDVRVPGPGQIDVLESAWKVNEIQTHTVSLKPAAHRFVFARTHVAAKHGGVRRLTVRPNARGLRLVAHHRGGPLRIRLWVTYQATGATPRSVGYYGLLVIR
jgi:hypothetical protein